MNDNKKFKVMCGLGAVWAMMLALMCTGEARFPRPVIYMVSALCVGWFAYWTLTYMWRKPSTPEVQPEQPTEQPKANVGKTKKSPKA